MYRVKYNIYSSCIGVLQLIIINIFFLFFSFLVLHFFGTSISVTQSKMVNSFFIFLFGYVFTCLYVRNKLLYSLKEQVFITKSAFIFFDKSNKKIKIPWADLVVGKTQSGIIPIWKTLWIHSKADSVLKIPLEIRPVGKEGLLNVVKINLPKENELYKKLNTLFPKDF